MNAVNLVHLTDDEIRTINGALSMARTRYNDVIRQLENGVPLIADYESAKESLRNINSISDKFDEITTNWMF